MNDNKNKRVIDVLKKRNNKKLKNMSMEEKEEILKELDKDNEYSNIIKLGDNGIVFESIEEKEVADNEELNDEERMFETPEIEIESTEVVKELPAVIENPQNVVDSSATIIKDLDGDDIDEPIVGNKNTDDDGKSYNQKLFYVICGLIVACLVISGITKKLSKRREKAKKTIESTTTPTIYPTNLPTTTIDPTNLPTITSTPIPTIEPTNIPTPTVVADDKKVIVSYNGKEVSDYCIDSEGEIVLKESLMPIDEGVINPDGTYTIYNNTFASKEVFEGIANGTLIDFEIIDGVYYPLEQKTKKLTR